ncbi:MAG: hypothetical protein L0Z54_01325 [Thermoplasmata archaeon]|nr:hypothetical protein [Thermoplasmata archaeon]
MRIAYYNFGNVREPRGDLHDEKGEPVLQKGEVVLAQDIDSGFELTRVQKGLVGRVFPTMIFPDIGSGELYRTDKRIIFLRIPPISHYAQGDRSWIDDPVRFMRLAKKWLQQGNRETVSIPVSMIRRTVRKRGDREVVLHIIHEGDRYIARLTPSSPPFM